jgi:hypothetical protein
MSALPFRRFRWCRSCGARTGIRSPSFKISKIRRSARPGALRRRTPCPSHDFDGNAMNRIACARRRLVPTIDGAGSRAEFVCTAISRPPGRGEVLPGMARGLLEGGRRPPRRVVGHAWPPYRLRLFAWNPGSVPGGFQTGLVRVAFVARANGRFHWSRLPAGLTCE